ncbi:hypothetical protein, partial [Chromobacterium amazonense]|uniref:hypothetical protein n=1 Tax=Chromobacterium amazonense TaxID=1382803 RepID=UPI0031F63734
ECATPAPTGPRRGLVIFIVLHQFDRSAVDLDEGDCEARTGAYADMVVFHLLILGGGRKNPSCLDSGEGEEILPIAAQSLRYVLDFLIAYLKPARPKPDCERIQDPHANQTPQLYEPGFFAFGRGMMGSHS